MEKPKALVVTRLMSAMTAAFLMSSLILSGCAAVVLLGENPGSDSTNQDIPETSLCPLTAEPKPVAGNEVGTGRGPEALPVYPGTVRISLFEPPE